MVLREFPGMKLSRSLQTDWEKFAPLYGPLSLVRCSGAPVSYHARDGFRQFMGEFGSPNFASPASLCMMPRMIAFHAVLGQTRAECRL